MSDEAELLRIGGVFRSVRQQLGYSQRHVAKLAGISPLRYSEIEAGRSGGRTTTILLIARSLGLELMFIPRPWVPAVSSLLDPEEMMQAVQSMADEVDVK